MYGGHTDLSGGKTAESAAGQQDQAETDMEDKKTSLILDLEPAFQRRLEAVAVLKGVSLRRYCRAAIDRELAKDEAGTVEQLSSDVPDHVMFAQLREEIFGSRPLPRSSVNLIREAREIRDAETEEWA